jgi:hypothetical protein
MGEDMIVKTLNEMENIVKNNKYLSWDGWSVINLIESEKGRTSAKGRFLNGKWYLCSKYEPSLTGWDIPDKFINSKGKNEKA